MENYNVNSVSKGMENKNGDKISKHNLNELAYNLIKGDIISCVLLPGMAISEGLLITRYGLSKSPTRSALTRLKQEGLITSRGQQGSVVSRIMLSDVQEIFQLRLLIDVTVAKLAAGNVNVSKIRALNKDLHTKSKTGKRNNMSDFLRANHRFHRYVAESSGNQRLAVLASNLMEQHERIVHLGLAKQNRRQDFVHYHDEFVEALINGDGERAGQIVETSLRKGQEKVMKALMMGSTDLISVVVKNLSLQ